MKLILILSIVWVVAVALPLDHASITKYNFDNTGKGYSYSWESSDGTKREETAKILNEGQENESLSVTGSFLYIGPDNIVYEVKYVADENGFQPVVSQHFPEPVAVPVFGPELVPEISSNALISLGGGALG